MLNNGLIFPKTKRLLIPGDFQRVFKQGRKQKGSFFTLIFCANGTSNARLGLAIAKRHVPLAVRRNTVRRIVRESFRHHHSLLNGFDVVVLVQNPLHDLSNAPIHEDLNQQWQILVRSLKISS